MIAPQYIIDGKLYTFNTIKKRNTVKDEWVAVFSCCKRKSNIKIKDSETEEILLDRISSAIYGHKKYKSRIKVRYVKQEVIDDIAKLWNKHFKFLHKQRE